MRLRKAIVAVMFFAGLFLLASARPAEGEVTVSVSFFHQELSPYGRWVVAGSYGDVWVPSGVASGWAPYVDGEWIWTDYGYTWVSADPWGDTPFHYGSWVWSDPYGWVWVPGTVWAPAWVTWAYTDDYIGWAPLSPAFVLSYNGYAGRPIILSQTRYCFVPTARFVGVPVASARVPISQNSAIFTRATKTTGFQVSGGVVHTAGPPQARIERAMGHRLERTSIERVHARPTSLAAAGFGKSRSLSLVMPAKQRSRELKTAGTETAGRSASSHEKTHVGRSDSHTKTSEHRTVATEKTTKPSTVHSDRSRATTHNEPKATSNEHRATSHSGGGSDHSRAVSSSSSSQIKEHRQDSSHTSHNDHAATSSASSSRAAAGQQSHAETHSPPPPKPKSPPAHERPKDNKDNKDKQHQK